MAKVSNILFFDKNAKQYGFKLVIVFYMQLWLKIVKYE